jgi:hypothetical protein
MVKLGLDFSAPVDISEEPVMEESIRVQKAISRSDLARTHLANFHFLRE